MQILAAPFAAGALFLPYPWCFLSLIPSNVIGEMWIGVTTAIVVDLAPTKIRTAAVALYLLYAFSSLLFLLAFFLMRLDLKRKGKVELRDLRGGKAVQ